MKGAPQYSLPVSIHLERHRRFMERRLKMPIANAGKNGALPLAPRDPRHQRSVVLPFERHDGDE